MKAVYSERFLIAIAVVLALFSNAKPLLAQASTGAVAQISGTVTDSTGAMVPGAEVKATQTNTGFTRTAVTGADGIYVLPNLIVGPYELQVTRSSFQTYLQRGIILQVNNNVTLNIKLQIGQVTQTVNVSANAAMVQMQSSSVSQVVEPQRVLGLPLNGRDESQLLLLSGMAVTSTYSDYVSSKTYPTSHTISVAGGQPSGVGYTLDGGTHVDLYGGANLPLPFPDALQEFSVQTSTIPAQYGGTAGGVVSVVTQSGTNRFHGDLFEFLRNGAVNARNFFAAKTDTLKRNQFGGTLGGPIIKDKLFFFGGYQGTRTRTAPPTSTFFVPTAAALNGDFSALESATCTSKPITLKNPAGGTFAGNYLNPTLFDSSAVQLAKKYLPQTSDPCGKVLIGIPSPNNEDQFIGRVDWIASSRNSIFVRYFNAHYTNPPVFSGDLLNTTRAGLNDMVQAATVGDNYSLAPNVINSLHLTWNRDTVRRGPAAILPSAADLGLNIANAPGNTPNTSVSGGFSVSCGTCANAYINRNTVEVTDDLSWIHGRHQITFGGRYARLQGNTVYATLQTGSYTFNGTFTGLGLADFMLGDVSSFTQGSPQIWYGRENRLGLYGQDSFRVSTRLTLMGGVRWEPLFPAYDIYYGGGTYFDPASFAAGVHSKVYLNAPVGMFYPGDTVPGFGTLPKAGVTSHLPDFEPRLGFAWDPTGSGRWSVRASYGIFSDLAEPAFYSNSSRTSPWGNALILTPSGGFSNPYSVLPGGDPFPVPSPAPANVFFVPGGQFITMPVHIHPANTQQWNLSIQRQVGANLLLSATYMGNKSTHRWVDNQLDPAVYIPGMCGASACSTTQNTQQRLLLTLQNPSAGALISSLGQVIDGGNAEYNGFLLTANRRLSKDFSVLANYTWSHCLSEGEQNSTGGGGVFQNPYNIFADRGNCVNDVRQILHLSYVATSPHFKGRITDKLLGNWEQAGIIGAQTGGWLMPLDGQDISLTNVGNDRPNLVGNPHLSTPTLAQWFNTSAYAKQATGTYGNAAVYSIEGPGGFTFDAQLTRAFKIRESQRLEVRFEAFNVLNHAVFANPGTTVTSTSTYGKILSANDPRILQFAMKYVF